MDTQHNNRKELRYCGRKEFKGCEIQGGIKFDIIS